MRRRLSLTVVLLGALTASASAQMVGDRSRQPRASRADRPTHAADVRTAAEPVPAHPSNVTGPGRLDWVSGSTDRHHPPRWRSLGVRPSLD